MAGQDILVSLQHCNHQFCIGFGLKVYKGSKTPRYLWVSPSALKLTVGDDDGYGFGDDGDLGRRWNFFFFQPRLWKLAAFVGAHFNHHLSPILGSGFLGMFPKSEFWQFTSIQLLDHLIRRTIHINNYLTIWWKGPATKSCRSGSATIFLLLIWETSADMRDKFLPIKSCSICRGSAKHWWPLSML